MGRSSDSKKTQRCLSLCRVRCSANIFNIFLTDPRHSAWAARSGPKVAMSDPRTALAAVRIVGNASRNRVLTRGWELQFLGNLESWPMHLYAFWVLKLLVLEIQSYLKTANNGTFLSTGKTLSLHTRATQKCFVVSCPKCFCCGRGFCCQRRSKEPAGKNSSYRFSLITSRGMFDWCDFRAYQSLYPGVKMPTIDADASFLFLSNHVRFHPVIPKLNLWTLSLPNKQITFPSYCTIRCFPVLILPTQIIHGSIPLKN